MRSKEGGSKGERRGEGGEREGRGRRGREVGGMKRRVGKGGGRQETQPRGIGSRQKVITDIYINGNFLLRAACTETALMLYTHSIGNQP